MKRILRLGESYALSKPNIKRHHIFLIGLLALTFFMCAEARAQRPESPGPVPAGIPLDSIEPLQIGDTIPEALWNLPLRVVNHPEGKDVVTLNDYRGKLIILDFWATTCPSCIKAMADLRSLQEQFSEKMAIIPITDQEPEIILKTLTTNPLIGHLGIYSVTGQHLFRKIFPYQIIPHYAWIDPKGVVAAITATQDITVDNVNMVLAQKKPIYAFKALMDTDQPIFLNQDIMPEAVQTQHYAILLKGMVPGLPTGGVVSPPDNAIQRFALFNRPLITQYRSIIMQLLGAKYLHKYVLTNVDSSDASFYHQPYSFDFQLPHEIGNGFYQKALDALNAAQDGYVAKPLQRKQRCVVITRMPMNDTNIDGKQSILKDQDLITFYQARPTTLIKRLNNTDHLKGLLVIDESGHTDPVDFTLQLPISSPRKLLKQLRQQGFEARIETQWVTYYSLKTTQNPDYRNHE